MGFKESLDEVLRGWNFDEREIRKIYSYLSRFIDLYRKDVDGKSTVCLSHKNREYIVYHAWKNSNAFTVVLEKVEERELLSVNIYVLRGEILLEEIIKLIQVKSLQKREDYLGGVSVEKDPNIFRIGYLLTEEEKKKVFLLMLLNRPRII